MRIGFFGTPELSATVLRDCLSANDVEVAYIVSQPDRPIGRHAILTASPVSQIALTQNIPLFRPEKIRENTTFFDDLKKFEVDFLVVVAYGKILPSILLSMPKILPINIHGSLLPKYRGASPIQSALLNGEKHTGVTIMEMTPGMDEGRILDMTPIDIDSRETSDTLFQKFGAISGTFLLSTLRKYLNHEITLREQDHIHATFTKKFSKDDGKILWSKMTAPEIYQLWQACTSWPGAWTIFEGKRYKICDCQVVKSSNPSPKNTPGTFWQTDNHQIFVETRQGIIELGEIIPEGKTKRKSIELLFAGKFEG